MRSFFEERFPNLRAIKSQVRDEAAAHTTIRPDGEVPWGTIGIALDYRLRFYFPAFRAIVESDFAAYLIVGGSVYDIDAGTVESGLRANVGVLPPDLLHTWPRAFAESLRDTLVRTQPFATRLEERDEERVCRYCFVLGLLEEVARARIGLSQGSPLASLSSAPTVDELLKLGTPASIGDLCQLSRLFFDTQRPLLDGETILNPIFTGSRDVGGADADVIVDRCLIEFKTAIDPNRISKASWPWQLLGYALLDYDDGYGLDAVGLYLARRGLLVRWPIAEFAAALAGREVSIAETRQSFRALHEPRAAPRET